MKNYAITSHSMTSKTSLLIAAILILGVGLCACETLDDAPLEGHSQSIIGGDTTNYESWKAVVALLHKEGMYASICTGTFISPQVILTAGHCVYYPQEGIDIVSNPTSIKILGGSDIFRYSKVVSFPKVETVVKHPSWKGILNTYSAVDLAMVKLSKPVPGIEYYLVRNSALQQYMEGTIVGYGLTSSTDETSSGKHRAGSTTILRLSQNTIELGQPSGTCQGDSGGPFFTTENGKDVVSGVTSFGVGQCSAQRNSYSVNAQNYRSWINSTMQTLVGYGLNNIPESPPIEEPNTDTGDDVDDEDIDKNEDKDKDTEDPSGDADVDNDEDPNGDSGDNGKDGDANNDTFEETGDLTPRSSRQSTSCRVSSATGRAQSPLVQFFEILFRQ